MSKNYQTILVAIDGSDESKKAFAKAIDIAKKDEAKLIITHVIDTRSFATVEHYDRTIITRAEQYGKEMLEECKVQAEKAGVPNVSIVLEFGAPKVKIPKDIVQKYEVDLVVSGATGLNAVERFFIGSVSEAITRHSKCDVLIVRS
ncbi:universal stress protein [Anaerobacillus sp. MEB173]|uniref:universal stress protein n=1 Tax=Anaerobacillus sp. MEB173 TaxID=3383345 RepID=UPI003F9038F1